MSFKKLPLLLFFIIQTQCTQKTKCPIVKSDIIVKDIQEKTPDYRLNIYLTPKLLLINGAKIARIKNGKFSNQSDETVYIPLLEAIYTEFKDKGNDPFKEIIIYSHDKLPHSLILSAQKTALTTHLAPVILMPIDFSITTCSYRKKTIVTPKSKKVLTIPNNILIRQDKDKIIVDGKTIIRFEHNEIPKKLLSNGGIVIEPLFKILKQKLGKLKKNTTPVLHITYDANLKLTKYILITAGKAGIYKLKTVRVLP